MDLNASSHVSSLEGSQPLSSSRRVLARKYRPKILKDLIGQDLLVQSLSRGLEEHHLPQAILLHGIRGTGKTSTARILARAINCVGIDGTGGMTATPCGVCPSCKALNEDRHPDVLEMDAASHTGVDDIRDIIDSAQYRAILGRYKVFIIDEVHMLSKSAFNALLKTLEEPPSHVLFIFATTEINKIPETILSRCARFDLKRVDSRVLMDHFQKTAQAEGYFVETDALAVLARSADGSVRDGLTLLDQAMNLTDATGDKTIRSTTVQSMIGATDRRRLYVVLQKIITHQAESLIEDVRSLVDEGDDPVAILQDLLECLYRVACFRILPRLAEDETIPEFERKAASALAKNIDNLAALSLWKKLLKAYEDVKKAPFAQQALEMTLLRVCFAASLPSLEEWLEAHPAPIEGNTGALSAAKAAVFASDQPQPLEDKGVQISHQTSPQNSSQSVITDVPSLVAALEKEREALLLSYIRHDMAFVSFEPGHIVVQTKDKDAPRALPLLKQFLHHITGEKWTVEVDTTEASVAQSLDEQRDAKRKAYEQTFLKTPLAQTIQAEFPQAQIAFDYQD